MYKNPIVLLLLFAFFSLGCLGIGGSTPVSPGDTEALLLANATPQAQYFLQLFPLATASVDSSGALAVDYRIGQNTPSHYYARLRIFIDPSTRSANDSFVECKRANDLVSVVLQGNATELLHTDACIRQVLQESVAPPAFVPPPEEPSAGTAPPASNSTLPPPVRYTGPKTAQEAFYLVTTNPETNSFALQYGPEYTTHLSELHLDDLEVKVWVNGEWANIIYSSKTYGVKDEQRSDLYWVPGELQTFELDRPFQRFDHLLVELWYQGNNIVRDNFTVPYFRPSPVTVGVLVLPVTTSDVAPPNYATAPWIDRLVFEDQLSATPLNEPTSLALWFRKNTNASVELHGNVTDWVVLPHSLEYYRSHTDRSGRLDSIDAFVKDAFFAIPDVNLSSFDYDRNHAVDFVLLLTPGPVTYTLRNPPAETGSTDHSVGQYALPAFARNGAAVTNYVLLDLSPTNLGDGHRYGELVHQMLRFLPLREYGAPPIASYWKAQLVEERDPLCYNLGPYDILAYGDALERTASNGQHVSVAGSLSGYTKYRLGYASLVNISWDEDGAVRLYRSDAANGSSVLVQVARSEDDPGQFYLLEWRQEPELQENNYAGLVIYRVTQRTLRIGSSPELCNTREQADLENNVYGINPRAQSERDIVPSFPVSGASPAPFTHEGEVFASPEGIRMEIVGVGPNQEYVDVEIQYPPKDEELVPPPLEQNQEG